MACKLTLKEIKPFTGCDGKLWPNEFLKDQIKEAVYIEDYEWAQECKDELDKRYLEAKRQRMSALKLVF